MANETAKNENTYTYTSIPHALMRQGLTSSACVLGGFFNSYGSQKNGVQRIASCTYARAEDDLRMPQATFMRSVKKLVSIGAVDRIKRSGYKYNGMQSGAACGFDVLPDWVRNTVFDIKTKKCGADGERIHLLRRLTYSEMLVFAVIFTRLANEKNYKAKYAVSHTEIASETGVSRRTVSSAVQVLLGAGLFHQEKGGGAKKNVYTLNLKRFPALGGARKRHIAKNPAEKRITVVHKLQSQIEAEKTAERQLNRYAENLSRQIAAEKAESNYRIACGDAEFKNAERQMGRLTFEIAMAEVNGGAEEEINLLNSRYQAACRMRSDALKRLKLSESDLPPDRRRT